MDTHIAVIHDFKTTNPEIEVNDWCMSGHAPLIERVTDYPKYINPQTWRFMDMNMIEAFQTEYDSFLRQFDGFLVGHVSAFAMVYEKYNKPILMINSCRYDMPFCFLHDFTMLTKWHECIERLHAKGLLTIVSNNRADQEYTRLGTGIRPLYNPSLCLYTNMKYNPKKNTFLCYTGELPNHPLIEKRSGHHQWSDIAEYRGIIHIPYEASTMSMFEQFTAGCPMFFPSLKFWKECRPDPLWSMDCYWGNGVPDVFRSQRKIKDGQSPVYLKPFRNDETWMKHSDIYTCFKSPNVHYFDSFAHLFQLLETFEYTPESRQSYIDSVYAEWKRICRTFISSAFQHKYPPHLSYNRLPILANVVYDIAYADIQPQHSYPFHTPLRSGDIVFVKTDALDYVLETANLDVPITLITGVSDLSPTQEQCNKILENPFIQRWIGCNIPVTHAKIRKVLIGTGEQERIGGNHEQLKMLHTQRVPWSDKIDDICIPYVEQTHASRALIQPTLPKLDFEDYMCELSKHRFVVCPRGNGIDTHRVCEVLLMGSVPVLEHSGLDDLYSKFPCLIVDSFEAIDTKMFTWDEGKYEAFLDMFWLRDVTTLWE